MNITTEDYIRTFLYWAVCFSYSPSKFEGISESVVAVFESPNNAEDFIEKCLPAENRDRFYIKHIDLSERGR